MIKESILESISKIYTYSFSPVIYEHRIRSEIFKVFSLSLSNLYWSSDQFKEDPICKELVRILFLYREEHSLAPIPLNNLGSLNQQSIDSINTLIVDIENNDAELGKNAKRVINNLDQCMASKDNPILDSIAQHITDVNSSKVPVLVKNSKLASIARKYIEKHIDYALSIITPESLRSDDCYDKILMCGSTGMFPPFLFQSPRSEYTHTFCFHWISSKQKLNPYFEASTEYPPIRTISIEPELSNTGADTQQEFPHPPQNEMGREDLINSIDEHEISVDIDWNRLLHNAESSKSIDMENLLLTKAKLFVLEDDKAIYLDTLSRKKIIDLDADAGKFVTDVSVNDIEIGMFLLHRTGQGGDIVPQIANQILGSDVHALRQKQSTWKKSLTERVESYGANNVCNALIKSGLTIANRQNLRNWVSPRSIKLNNYTHFFLLMHFIGRSEEAMDLWESMEKIRSAHRRAGHFIRQELIKQVEATNLNRLAVEGKTDLTLKGMEEQQITASRIKFISSEEVSIPDIQIEKIFYSSEIIGT